jgi:hypothetical protein
MFLVGIAVVGVMNICIAIHSAVLGMWTKASVEHGGLGWSTSRNVSIVLAVGVFTLVIYSISSMTRTIKAIGDTNTCLLGIGVAIPTIALFPIAHYLLHLPALLWMYLIVLQIIM